MSADIRIPIVACDAADIDESNVHCEGCFERFPVPVDESDTMTHEMWERVCLAVAQTARHEHIRTCVAYRDFVVEETLDFYARLDAERTERRA